MFTAQQTIRRWIGCVVVLMAMGCSSSDNQTKTPQSTPQTIKSAPMLELTPTAFNASIRDLFGMPSSADQWPDSPDISNRLSPIPADTSNVFGVTSVKQPAWPWRFPHELGVDGFQGMADGQVPSAYQLEELRKAAMHFAGFALISPIFFTCKSWAKQPAADQKTCGWSSIERFAQRAWRRPLSEDERTRLQTFWASNWAENTPEEAIALTVGGILQSPSFLFRIEHGTRVSDDIFKLNGWEMASRLSYLLWETMPDGPLFAAAANGELSTPEGIEKQARRMLADPKARPALIHFHMQWLELEQIQNIAPARRAYGPLFGLDPQPPLDTTGDGQWPAVLSPIRHSMEAETSLFIERTVFDGAGSLSALLTDNHGYMSDFTAPLYGDGVKRLGGPTEKWQYGLVTNSIGAKSSMTLYPVAFPKSERAGMLTLPSVLALGAYAVHPGPILRGKRILERLACQSLGTPPPGAEAELPPDVAMSQTTNRQRTEMATSPDVCAGCHNVLNPPGFAFEHYDALGRIRSDDYGQPIDASGSFGLYNGETFMFKDGVELATQLSNSDAVKSCYVLRWARYATGVEIDSGHVGLKALQTQFGQDDNIQRLLLQLVQSDLFRYRRLTNEVTP